jgi:hypothetical protein
VFAWRGGYRRHDIRTAVCDRRPDTEHVAQVVVMIVLVAGLVGLRTTLCVTHMDPRSNAPRMACRCCFELTTFPASAR